MSGGPMNAERLLDVYEQISEAPDAITRLRRFVLDLAVRGKLVEQDLADEPAQEFLKKVRAEKARLTQAGVLRKSKALKPINAGDHASGIPTSWSWARLGDLIDLVSGQHLQPAEYSEDPKAGIPYITGPSDFGDKKLVIRRYALVRKAVATKGQLLLTVKGSGVGKTAPCNLDEVAISRQLMALTPILLNAGFLELLAHGLASKLQDEARSLIPGISRDDVNLFAVAVPPLAEQHRIAAKVDELMALCDRLEEARKTREEVRDKLTAASLARLTAPDTTAEDFPAHAAFALEALPALTTRPDQIKTLRQTILNLAVRGKLVEQDPADDPAIISLGRLKVAALQAFRDEGLRARKPVAPATRRDLKFDFPGSWELPIFDDVFVMVSGVTKGGKVSPQDAQVRPYLRVANVQRGHLDLGVIKTIDVKPADAERFRLKDGDILMTEGGDWDKLGRAAIWRCQIDDCIHQNHVFRVRPPSDDILPEWVITYVNSELGRSFFEDASKQTTNLASINMTQLRGCPLPLPPLAEQHRIVAKVDALMALCDRLEAAMTTTDTTRTRLLEALLHEALDPAVTPASEAAE